MRKIHKFCLPRIELNFHGKNVEKDSLLVYKSALISQFNSTLAFVFRGNNIKISQYQWCFIYPPGLMKDGKVSIEDNLVDSNNRPILASVNFEVRYSSPENVEGNFDSPTVSKFVHQQSLDDDQQMLLNIEQNIANLERSLNKGICSSGLLNNRILLGRSSVLKKSRHKKFQRNNWELL